MSATAFATNADGSVVVGTVNTQSGPRAFLWTESLQMVDLNAHLASLGVDLSGWTLTSARGVSTNGRTIAGDGYHGVRREGWIATLDCYPNCDFSTTPPVLNVADFICFLNKYAAGDAYANCDASTVSPVLNVVDFVCYMNRYAAGCS